MIALVTVLAAPAAAATLTGPAAFGDWRADSPGVVRKITLADLPPDRPAPVTAAPPSVVPRPAGAELHTLPGFTVAPFVTGLQNPRLVRVAPNGDIFIAESQPGKIRVLRAADGAAKPSDDQIFAEGLDRPFGIAFYPAGPNPQWVYIANTSSVVRFPYRSGDMKARGPAQVVVPTLPHGGNHWTRDVVFTQDGKTMLVSVGSASNAGEDLPKKTPAEKAAWAAGHTLGAAWGRDENRADVLAFDPEGKGQRVYASGIRNCAGEAINPTAGSLWCATNERDLLGDNLPPDYVTQVKPGGFYGWPWWYIGDHEDPRHAGERPDLKGKITTPDVLIQPHSAPLEMTFYDARSGGSLFPTEYRGDAFVALHGSWDRNKRTGYKIVRVRTVHGQPTGEYKDFVTGFVADDKSVWGRPVGVTVAHDGALLFTDDGGDELWRVSYARH
jgi:hypothetical protein